MRMSMAVRSMFRYAIGITTILVFAGVAQAQTGKVVQGPCRSVFGAEVCTSYRTVSRKVTAITMRVPVAAIEQAPANVPMVWPPKPDVEVPFAPAVQEQTGFTYTNIYWEVHGHPPAAYLVPHFDFHFYFIPEAKVQKIDCKDIDKPQTLPSGYRLADANFPHMGTLVGTCIPAMGMHASPDADFNPKIPWKGSLIVGYYAQKPIFLETMITRELLLRKHTFSFLVPEIAPTPHVRYPKQLRAVYLPKAKAYDLTFLY